MKILEITDSLANGGAEKFLVELSNELIAENEVIICCTSKAEEWMQPYKNIHKSVRLVQFNNRRKINILLFIRLLSVIRNLKPDIIHIHSSVTVFYVFIISMIERKAKYIQTVHNTLTPGYMKLFKFINMFYLVNKKFLNICISKQIYLDYLKVFPNLQYRQIDNGIMPVHRTAAYETVSNEINKYRYSEDTKIFIAIGNYSDYKNFKLLMNIFASFDRNNVNAVLLILGEASQSNYVNYEYIKKNKTSNIYQLGFKNNVADYLYCADALVMSSSLEGMPLTVLEAFSVGLPVISTPAGGVVNIIENGINGFLCDDFTEDSMTERVIDFLKMPQDELNKIKINNINKYETRYSMKICSAKYLKLFSEYK